MDLLDIAEYAVKTIIIGGIVLVIGAIVKNWTDKVLHEHQIRFSKLHNDRADFIRELYSKLVRMEISLRYYMKRFEFENEPSDDEKRTIAIDDVQSFFKLFSENRIFFDEDICRVIDDIDEEFRKAWIDFHFWGDVSYQSRVKNSEDANLKIEAYNRVGKRIPELRKSLEGKFRELLGVVKT